MSRAARNDQGGSGGSSLEMAPVTPERAAKTGTLLSTGDICTIECLENVFPVTAMASETWSRLRCRDAHRMVALQTIQQHLFHSPRNID